MVMYTDGLIEFNRNLVNGEARLLTATAESLQLRCKAAYLTTFTARCKGKRLVLFIAKRILGNVPTSIDVADLVVLTHSCED
jgi:hypothetical protein